MAQSNRLASNPVIWLSWQFENIGPLDLGLRTLLLTDHILSTLRSLANENSYSLIYPLFLKRIIRWFDVMDKIWILGHSFYNFNNV